MLFVLPTWITRLVLALVLIYALARGGRDERIVAICMLLDNLYDQLHPHYYGQMLASHLLRDGAQTLVFGWLALGAERYWLLLAAAVGLATVVTDVAELILRVHGWAYGTAMLVWGYLLLFTLAYGTWQAVQARTAARLRTAG